MSKRAIIIERIAALEAFFNKSGNQLGLDAGIGNGTVGGWNDNLIGKPSQAVKQFLRHYDISYDWWKTGKGEIFNTSVQKEAAVPQNALGVSWESAAFKKIFEGSAEYVLVHKTALENHRFTSVEQIEASARELAASRDDTQKLVKEFIDFVKGTYGLSRLAEPPKIQETQKDTPV